VAITMTMHGFGMLAVLRVNHAIKQWIGKRTGIVAGLFPVILASWIVPQPQRAAWRSCQKRELDAWWKLVDVGELTTYSSHEIVRNLKQTCLDFSLSRP